MINVFDKMSRTIMLQGCRLGSQQIALCVVPLQTVISHHSLISISFSLFSTNITEDISLNISANSALVSKHINKSASLKIHNCSIWTEEVKSFWQSMFVISERYYQYMDYMCAGLTLSCLTVSCYSEKKTENKKTRSVIISCSFYISLDHVCGAFINVTA